MSGIAYRAFAEGLEDNPGLTATGWLGVAEANRIAQRGNPLLIAKNDTERSELSMEHRFGELADATLTRAGVVTDDDSRWKLIEALGRKEARTECRWRLLTRHLRHPLPCADRGEAVRSS